MFGFIWNEILYRPLFNVLIWLYNTVTDHNLGWAVILLTIGLRIVMLPLSIIEEMNKIKNEQLKAEIRTVAKEFKYDKILQKEQVRKMIKKRKVRPWAKTLGLGLQLLALVLLYQVFLRGITGEKIIKIIYDWVDFPGTINTKFYGFNLGMTHDIIWPGIVAIFLLAEIYLEFRRSDRVPTKTDLIYFIFFPLVSFYILWMLPMVKSLFVLTSIVFSVIINRLLHAILRPKKAVEKAK